MPNQDFTRLLIEGTVNRTLNQIRKDPQRSIRNLVDLGVTFSRGRFQRNFLEIAQNMLENENSAYYDLLDLLVHQVNPAYFKHFGVNLGYEGLTRGARIIRSIEKVSSYNIPWVLSMACGPEALDCVAVEDIVQQGIEQGIYVYMLQGNEIELEMVQEIVDKFSKCAFFLFTSGKNVVEQSLEPLKASYNLYISVETDEMAMEAVEIMSALGLLYGIHKDYQDDSCISPEMLESYMNYRPAMVILFPAGEDVFSLSEQLYPKVKELRLQQKYPYFLMEALGDSLFIDRIISGDPCMLTILGDGQALGVCTGGISEVGNILDIPLNQILRQTVPKTYGDGR